MQYRPGRCSDVVHAGREDRITRRIKGDDNDYDPKAGEGPHKSQGMEANRPSERRREAGGEADCADLQEIPEVWHQAALARRKEGGATDQATQTDHLGTKQKARPQVSIEETYSRPSTSLSAQ